MKNKLILAIKGPSLHCTQHKVVEKTNYGKSKKQ